MKPKGENYTSMFQLTTEPQNERLYAFAFQGDLLSRTHAVAPFLKSSHYTFCGIFHRLSDRKKPTEDPVRETALGGRLWTCEEEDT